MWGAYISSPAIGVFLATKQPDIYQDFDKLYVSYLKFVSGIKSKVCNIAVVSELGRYPYSLKILKSKIGFVSKIVILINFYMMHISITVI